MELNYMKQEEKDLLLKDLCGRLPYGVKLQLYNGELDNDILNSIDAEEYIIINGKDDIETVKPYLFPLSSMTEEQSMEFALLQVNTHKDGFLYVCDCANMMKWLLKNHFDIYGLVEKGLAIDATNLEIY